MREKRNKAQIAKDFFLAAIVVFLLMFMIFIFGPAEIYFVNSAQFDFLYWDFAKSFMITSLGVTVLSALLIAMFPKVLRKIVIATLFGCAVPGYLQMMFFNRDLQLLGENPEKYHPEMQKAILNTFIWGGLIVASVVFVFVKTEACKKVITYVSVCLLLIQLVAFGSLFLNAEQSCFERMPEGEAYLS